MLVMFNSAVPMLLRVTTLGALVLPTCWSVKLRLAGEGVAAGPKEACNSTAAAAHGPVVFIVTAFVTDEGLAAVLSLTAAPTVVVSVKLPLSRRFPTPGKKLLPFFSPKPATTQPLALCVVRAMLRMVPDPVFVAVAPNIPTPEYSTTSTRFFTIAERFTVIDVEALARWAAHISTRALVPLLTAAINV